MDLDVIKSGTTPFVTLKGVSPTSTVEHIKKLISRQKPALYPERISLRLQARGKSLPDSAVLSTLELNRGKELFLKDLGPQIGWTTVFLCEYAGPLIFYMLTYPRPALIYGSMAQSNPVHHPGVEIAAACWIFHYVKRLLETVFVHRFSHATMPIMNLFKNCTYYWGFAFYVGYFVNHPLYTPALLGKLQIYTGLALFIFAELGNFSIHIALRNLRPAGSKERKIPKPTANPFTLLFNFVACPNYTYELLAWTGFSIITQAVPALMFAAAGGGQMTIWALGKLRNYKKEFPTTWPRGRKAIIPFVI